MVFVQFNRSMSVVGSCLSSTGWDHALRNAAVRERNSTVVLLERSERTCHKNPGPGGDTGLDGIHLDGSLRFNRQVDLEIL